MAIHTPSHREDDIGASNMLTASMDMTQVGEVLHMRFPDMSKEKRASFLGIIERVKTNNPGHGDWTIFTKFDHLGVKRMIQSLSQYNNGIIKHQSIFSCEEWERLDRWTKGNISPDTHH